MRRRLRTPALAFVALFWTCAASYAQMTSAPRPASETRWEVDGHFGVSLGRLSTGGARVLPAPGAPIPTSSPIFPSWRVPSWFVGDGAAFLNNVAAEFGVASRITPLDAALGPRSLGDAGAAEVGVRLRRRLSARYSVESGVDVTATRLGFPDSLVEAVDATRATFQTTMAALLATGPFSAPTVSTSATVAAGSGREIALTGSLVRDYAPWAGFLPFTTIGAGVILQAGRSPSLAVDGRYRFTIAGSVPIDETDRVTLEYSRRPSVVVVVGGGVRRDVSPRVGVRLDARMLLGPGATHLALDARPVVATGAPAGFVESFTYPNLQFSNNPSTGRESTLSGTLENFDTSKGGWQTRIRLTGGVVVKF